MSWCCKKNNYSRNPKGITYKSIWWRACTKQTCPSLSCGSQMRRKAEVLRHLNNQNQMTKKEKFSYFINFGKKTKVNSVIQRNLQLAAFQGAADKCEASQSRPAYYSNVPGNSKLFFDKQEPLINYRIVRYYPTSTQRLRYRRSNCFL